MVRLPTIRLKPRMRLDVFLYENGYADSRTEAKLFITSCAVTVNGKVINKPSFDVTDASPEITVDRSQRKYVSRGGFKLEGALLTFGVKPSGKRALDVGASSGGFTDCLLQNGAIGVIAVDSGEGQLNDRIRNDERVSVRENFNARYMTREDLPYIPELCVMDVSFISATYIIPSIYECLSDDGEFICLIKPQFEVGKEGLGKGGIVKSERYRRLAIDKVTSFAKEIGFTLIGVEESSIKGGDGNTEYVAYFRK